MRLDSPDSLKKGPMRKSTFMRGTTVLLVFTLVTGLLFGADCGTATSRLLSARQLERRQALDELSSHDRTRAAELVKVLEKAASTSRADNHYLSPLHAAILAVDACRVDNADALLLSLVDYEIDSRSMPLGMTVSGNFFYPAAGALVRLRVDVEKVVQAIESAESEKSCRLLAWVLFKRVGDVERARNILFDASRKSYGVTERQNLRRASNWIDTPSELLPPREKREH